MPSSLELRKAALAYFLLALLLMPAMLLGRIYLPTSVAMQNYPWRNLSAGHNLTLGPPLNPFLADCHRIFYPVDCLLHEWLPRGQVPLWEPYTMCGRPLHAAGHDGLLYPPKLLLVGLLGPGLGHNLFLFLHFWAAGWLAYRFFRLWVDRPLAAGLGGLIWMLNGFQTIYLENKCVVGLSPLTAWCLLELELLLRRPGRGPALRLGLALGLCILVGHPQLALYAFLYFAVYTLARLWVLPWRKGRLLWLVAAGILGVLWGAPQWCPTLELAGLAARPDLGWDQHLRENRFFPENLVTLVVPEFLGNPEQQFFLSRFVSGVQTPVELTGHVGMVAMQLAFLCLPLWRRRWVRFHALAVLTVLLLVSATPLLHLLFWLLPPLSKFTYTRFLMLLPWSVAALAATGMQAWLEGEVRPHPLWLLPLLTSAVVAWACWQVQTASPLFRQWMELWGQNGVLLNYCGNYQPLHAFQSLVTANIGHFYRLSNSTLWLPLLLGFGVALLAYRPGRTVGILLASLSAGELLLFSWHWNPTGTLEQLNPPFPAVSALQAAPRMVSLRTGPAPNTLASYFVHDAGGYDSLYPRAYRDLFLRLQGGELYSYHIMYLTKVAADFQRWADLLAIQDIVCDPISPANDIPPGWKARVYPELTLYENPHPRSRARLVVDGGSVEPVHWLEDSPNRCVMQVQSEQGGLLVFTDQNYPGWECAIDGRIVPVQTINVCFRGVAVPPGPHRLEWNFRSKTVRAGLLAATLAMLLSLFSRLYRRRDGAPGS